MPQARSLSGDTLYNDNGSDNERTPLLNDALHSLSIPSYRSSNVETDTPRSSSSSSILMKRRKKKPTPLPKLQLAIVLILQICEPITSQSIYPYINQLISELDITNGDTRKVGYYAGLIESLFFVVEAMTVLQWSRASDYVGRKPILLIGLVGTIASMLSFGFSTTFLGLVISRCLTGLLNGNVGVMKSAMGDLTDATNRAEGFALMPVTWAIGCTLGPLLGGVLARPQDHWPNAFPGKFWSTYAYLLPCIATASVVTVIFFLTLVLFKESNPRKRRGRTASEDTLVDEEAPLPMRQLLTFPVVLSISSYVLLAFLNISFVALFPLFCAMPVSIGGIGLTPSDIGYIMGAYGVFTGIFQFCYFAKIVEWLGEKRMYGNGIMSFLVLFGTMPAMNWNARAGGPWWVQWALMGVVIVAWTIMDMAYGAVFMYVTSSAPTKSSLGAVNGISQTVVSMTRAIGPAMATALFSFCAEKQLLGGYAVYVVFGLMTVGGLVVADMLPEEAWDAAQSREEEDDD